MSKSWLIEYLKLIPKGIANADKVLEGFVNAVKFEHGTLPEDEQAEIVRRRLICASCPFMSSNAVTNPALNYKTKRFDEHCIHCGCPIQTKTAALDEKCGIQSYNNKHRKNPLPLKWDVYIKNQTNEQQTS